MGKSKEIIEIKNKKVAIVGFAPSWNLAPFDDPTFDVWGINELYLQAPGRRFTAWFEIHDPFSPSKNVPKHHEWLNKLNMPLYMQRKFDEFPASIPYPREEVKSMVNVNMVLADPGSPYTDFSNQITWMILLAIYQGYEEIHVYGVDMAQQSEYAWQRASCQFAIGFALGRNIKILIPSTSELCKYPKDYGFETDNAPRHLKKTRIKSLQQSILGYKGQISDIEYQYNSKHKEFEIFKKVTEDKILQIGDEIVKLSVMVESNKGMIDFLSSMPMDINEILSKRDNLVLNINKQTEALNNTLKQLEAQAKELNTKLEAQAKLDYTNQKIYEETKQDFEKRIMAASGAASECNYDLENNRI